jgi:hypothetical protein
MENERSRILCQTFRRAQPELERLQDFRSTICNSAAPEEKRLDFLYLPDTVHDVTIVNRSRSNASAELLGQRDDDALGAADVTEPIFVLVLRQLANELGAMGAKAGKDVLDVFDGENDATYA